MKTNALKNLQRNGKVFPYLQVIFEDRPEQKFIFSIQGSSIGYCEPRENLPCLGDYSNVELAIWKVGEKSHYILPSLLLGEDFEVLDNPHDPSGFVSWEDIGWMLRRLAGMKASLSFKGTIFNVGIDNRRKAKRLKKARKVS